MAEKLPLGADGWVQRVLEVSRFQTKSGSRAPYKPLLVLWLIGRVANGRGPEVKFEDAEAELARLLKTHRVSNTAPSAANPFVYLASQPELWTVNTREGEDVRQMPQSQRESPPFLRENAIGRLAPRFAAALGDAELRNRIVNEILRSEFPETLHGGILAEVGLAESVRLASAPRDPEFQKNVPRAYEFSCAFCNFRAMLLGELVGLDAAHVRMHSKDGPSTLSNGILLCALHHRLFDRGALGLSEDRRILVSQELDVARSPEVDSVLRLSGQPMRMPQMGYDPPAPEHIEWHYENLFKPPARALA